MVQSGENEPARVDNGRALLDQPGRVGAVTDRVQVARPGGDKRFWMAALIHMPEEHRLGETRLPQTLEAVFFRKSLFFAGHGRRALQAPVDVGSRYPVIASRLPARQSSAFERGRFNRLPVVREIAGEVLAAGRQP